MQWCCNVNTHSIYSYECCNGAQLSGKNVPKSIKRIFNGN